MVKKSKNTSLKRRISEMTPVQQLLTGVVLLIFAYILGSLALDSGSLLEWALAIVAAIWGFERVLRAGIQYLKS